MSLEGGDPQLYRPLPEGTPIDTTELDWRLRAREDGWELVDGQWEHPERGATYDDDQWVYLGDGNWEDAEVVTWTPEQRREFLGRYAGLVHDTIDTIREAEPPPPSAGGPGRAH